MRAGSLDRRVDLLKRVETLSATGARSETFEPVAEGLFAHKQDRAHEQPNVTDGAVSMVSIVWRIWHRDDVEPDWRVRYPAGAGGRLYRVTGVEEVGRREGLLLHTIVEVIS